MENDIISTRIGNLTDKRSLAIRKQIDAVAPLKNSVLLLGETGVGKDFWAEYLFRQSGFRSFLNLNCGDVPDNLIDSEWFGYKKGAFTGAERDFEGKWAQADKGILFLNQIDLLSLNVQSRLLRIIERKIYYPLGSTSERKIDVKFIFSADEDIEKQVRENRFRADLYYRISPYMIKIPPLRDRKQDIISLLHYFTDREKIQLNLSEEGLKSLTDYPWYGNIRELENFVTRVAVTRSKLRDTDLLELVDNPEAFFDIEKNKGLTLKALESRYIQFHLERNRNKSDVARLLGISRKSLYNKIKQIHDEEN